MENEMVNGSGNRDESRRGPRVCAVVLLSSVLLNSSCASFAKSDAFLSGRMMGKLESDALRELSGIAASRRNPGVLYVHNDSGDAPQIYAISEKAQLLGTCHIRGATQRDWEDIAVGPGPDPDRSCVYIGDIGDNAAKRPEIIVYRVPEPQIDAVTPFDQMTTGAAEALRLVYPDKPRDAETLLVDPLTRDIYIISKRELAPRVYRAAYPQSTSRQTKLEQVAVLPLGLFPTGGDVSPDGRHVIVRGMFNAALWERPVDERSSNAKSRVEDPVPLGRAFSGQPRAIPIATEPQGEAICFDSKGAGYFTISEGRHPTLYYFAPSEPNTARQ
jgi:hypothetical protein